MEFSRQKIYPRLSLVFDDLQILLKVFKAFQKAYAFNLKPQTRRSQSYELVQARTQSNLNTLKP